MNALTRLAGQPRTVTNIVVGLILAALLAVETASTDGVGARLFVLAFGLLMSALALVRERNRTLAAAAGLIVGATAAVWSAAGGLPSQPGYTATAALLVLAAAAVRISTPRNATVIALAGVVVMVIGRVSERPQLIAPLILLGVLLWGGALGLGIWLRSLDTHRAAAIDAARRDERLELARELHDVVAHHVAGIVIQAQAARIVAAKDPTALDHTLIGIESTGTEALAAMRRVIGLLRDADDAGTLAPGPEGLTELVDRFSRHGPAVKLHLPTGDSPPWSPEVTTTAYRIVQEALTNVILHAPQAQLVTVSVQNDPSTVLVDVTDDAPAQPSASPWSFKNGGYGLIGMRERVEALGGSFHAGPCHDHSGWGVHAAIPTIDGKP